MGVIKYVSLGVKILTRGSVAKLANNFEGGEFTSAVHARSWTFYQQNDGVRPHRLPALSCGRCRFYAREDYRVGRHYYILMRCQPKWLALRKMLEVGADGPRLSWPGSGVVIVWEPSREGRY